MTAIFLFFYFIFSKKKKRTSIALFRSRIILLPENTFSASRSKNTKTKNKKIKSLWPFASRHRCTSSHQEPTCSSQIGEWKSDKKHTNYFLFLMKKKKKKKNQQKTKIYLTEVMRNPRIVALSPFSLTTPTKHWSMRAMRRARRGARSRFRGSYSDKNEFAAALMWEKKEDSIEDVERDAELCSMAWDDASICFGGAAFVELIVFGMVRYFG